MNWSNDEAAKNFDRKELLKMCAEKIKAREANAWMKGYYIGNRHLEEGFPSLAELTADPDERT